MLALAAEEFGKGNDISNFKVSGASDVRRACDRVYQDEK